MTDAKMQVGLGHPTFVAACIAGDLTHADVDDWVEAWHERRVGEGLALDRSLGLTPAQYSAFLRNPEALPAILDEHGYADAVRARAAGAPSTGPASPLIVS